MRCTDVHTKRALQTNSSVCSVLFVLFSAVYLYFLQPFLLAQEQHFFSHGRTTYDGFLGAFLITAILTFLGLFLHRMLRLPSYFQAVAWMPSCYILGLLSSLHFPHFASDAHSAPLFLLIAFPLLFVLLLYVSKSFPDTSHNRTNQRSALALNITQLFLMFLCVGTLGNCSSRFHAELRAANFSYQARHQDALKVAANSPDVTHYLSAVRAYSLSAEGQLGDRLFHYPQIPSSKSLLLHPNDTLHAIDITDKIYNHLGYYPLFQYSFSPKHFLTHVVQKDTLSNSPAIEYLLSAYLLDAELPSFAKLLFEKKDTTTALTIATHYKEALLLYEHLTAEADSFAFINDSIRMAYSDFLYTKDSLQNRMSTLENCKRKYGKTYWFYYYFVH